MPDEKQRCTSTQVFQLNQIDSSCLNGPCTGIMAIEKSKRHKHEKVSEVKEKRKKKKESYNNAERNDCDSATNINIYKLKQENYDVNLNSPLQKCVVCGSSISVP